MQTREERNAYYRKWRSTHKSSPEQKAKARERHKKWRLINKSHVKECHKKWQLTHKDSIKKLYKEWSHLNREHKNEWNRIWYAKRRASYFAGKVCKNCASVEHLELHHVDPKTKISNTIWEWAETRRLAELEKCEVLCHDCHMVETIKQRKEKAKQRKYGI